MKSATFGGVSVMSAVLRSTETVAAQIFTVAA